jgi:hypothetical protein
MLLKYSAEGFIEMIREIKYFIASFSFVILLIAAGAGAAFAQGSRKDDIVFNAQGRPMAGAAVRVCTSAATGQPCTPLAQVYSDAALTQALANPLSADGMGNYSFYAAPGRYMIELSGPGIITKQIPNVILPSDPNSPTFANLNNILYVGTAAGQYASLQAAHDALPSAGGTIFVMATGTPFGAAGTTSLTITKPIHIIFDEQVFTYSGSAAQAILLSSASGVLLEGSGNANGQPSGSTASGGAQIFISNTAANGIDANVAPGVILKNFTVLGPASGTGKGIILTANSGHLYDLNVRAFGGNGVEINGTRGNSNNVSLDRVTSVSNGGWGFNVFGVNGNLTVFNHTSGTNNTLGNYQVATATNVFLGAHSQTSGTGTGVTFPSGGSNNWGDIYSEIGDETTAVAFATGANNNYIFLPSQIAFTNSGIGNSIFTNRSLVAGGSVSGPGYSFSGSTSTGFYDTGGGTAAFSSAGTANEVFGTASHRLGSGLVYAWSSNANPTAAGNDTGISRDAADVIDLGNGFAGDKTAKVRAALYTADGGTACTNGELNLSANWGNTGSPTVTAVAGTGQTCQWTITAGGMATGANPTITDTLTNPLPTATTVCEMRMVGGTGAATLINQTALSATAPVFTFGGMPGAGSTYVVVRRCGP